MEDDVLVALKKLFSNIEIGIQRGLVLQHFYFAIYLMQHLVRVQLPAATTILKTIPPTLITQMLKILPNLFNPFLILKLHDLQTPTGRANAAKDLCVIRNITLRSVSP